MSCRYKEDQLNYPLDTIIELVENCKNIKLEDLLRCSSTQTFPAETQIGVNFKVSFQRLAKVIQIFPGHGAPSMLESDKNGEKTIFYHNFLEMTSNCKK